MRKANTQALAAVVREQYFNLLKAGWLKNIAEQDLCEEAVLVACEAGRSDFDRYIKTNGFDNFPSPCGCCGATACEREDDTPNITDEIRNTWMSRNYYD